MPQIRKTAQALLNALDSPDGELSILILDDPQIARLNQQYRDRQGPTNVLAFPMQEEEFSGIKPDLLGDVVISIETAAKEALFGYDHEKSEEAAAQMDQKTEELIKIIRRSG